MRSCVSPKASSALAQASPYATSASVGAKICGVPKLSRAIVIWVGSIGGKGGLCWAFNQSEQATNPAMNQYFMNVKLRIRK